MESQPVVVPKKPSSLPIIVLVILLLFSLAASGFLYYQNRQLQHQITAFSLSQNSSLPTPPPTLQPSAASAQEATASWQTYTNTTYNLSLLYPPTVTLYQADQLVSVNTLTYIPVCDVDKSVVCIYYPNSRYLQTNFKGAGLSFNVLKNLTSEKSCTNLNQAEGIKIINGVTFTTGSEGGVAAGNQNEDLIYRTFHQNTCIELVIRMVTNSSDTNDSTGSIRTVTRDEQVAIISDLRQILSTFKFTEPQTTKSSLSFQQILTQKCQFISQNNVSYYAVKLSDLPFNFAPSFTSRIATGPNPISCDMWDTTNQGSVFIRYDQTKGLNLYDKNSQEGGHGGPPNFGSHSTIIQQANNLTLSIDLAWPHGGCALIGDTSIYLRGEKTFTFPNGDLVYANTQSEVIPGDDPRLTALLQPDGQKCDYEASKLAVVSTTNPIAKIKNRFFSDMNNLAEPEKTNVANLLQTVNSITLK